MRKKDKLIKKFFRKEVIGLDFSSRPDYINEDSYFEKPQDNGRTYFSFFGTDTEEQLSEEVKDYYERKGVTISDAFADKLAKLAFHLKDTESKDNKDLPDYIYIMH